MALAGEEPADAVVCTEAAVGVLHRHQVVGHPAHLVTVGGAARCQLVGAERHQPKRRGPGGGDGIVQDECPGVVLFKLRGQEAERLPRRRAERCIAHHAAEVHHRVGGARLPDDVLAAGVAVRREIVLVAERAVGVLVAQQPVGPEP